MREKTVSAYIMYVKSVDAYQKDRLLTQTAEHFIWRVCGNVLIFATSKDINEASKEDARVN